LNPLFRHTVGVRAVKRVTSHEVLEVIIVARASSTIGWEETSTSEGSTAST